MENGWSFEDPDLLLNIFHYQEKLLTVNEQIMRRASGLRIAYGTYGIRDDNNRKVYIAKTIRENHNEEDLP